MPRLRRDECPISSNQPVDGVGRGAVGRSRVEVFAGSGETAEVGVAAGRTVGGSTLAVTVAGSPVTATQEIVKIIMAERSSQRSFMAVNFSGIRSSLVIIVCHGFQAL